MSPNDVVELQWKGGQQSPFGYWRGVVENVSDTFIDILFPHYLPGNQWRLIRLANEKRITDQRNRGQDGSTLAGFVGGIRVLSPHQDALWQPYLPAGFLRDAPLWKHPKDTMAAIGSKIQLLGVADQNPSLLELINQLDI